MSFSVQAVILDEEPVKPAIKPEPKVKKSNTLEKENQRIKQELEAMKKAKQEDEQAKQEQIKQQKEAEFQRMKQELEGLQEQQNQAKQRADEAEKAKKAVADSIEMIRLPSGIAMGKTEVTQGQWRAVMSNNPSKFTSCGDNCPVEQVSWDDLQQFIQRLNSQTGKRFRLPSEDEWYAACQAGSVGSEYCGSNSIDAVAWYYGNSGITTHPVGQKQPNAWGLYDMSGNVWEWSNSCYENDCSHRVVRGGSWNTEPASVRSASRDWRSPSLRNSGLGFRLAQDP